MSLSVIKGKLDEHADENIKQHDNRQKARKTLWLKNRPART
jgi:hypothetical protein